MLGINALLLPNYKKHFKAKKKRKRKWTFKILNSYFFFYPPYHALTLVGNHSHTCHLLHTKKILQKFISPNGLKNFKCIDLFSKSPITQKSLQSNTICGRYEFPNKESQIYLFILHVTSHCHVTNVNDMTSCHERFFLLHIKSFHVTSHCNVTCLIMGT